MNKYTNGRLNRQTDK